jgi:protein-glutamine gamma-glutamyltransferase
MVSGKIISEDILIKEYEKNSIERKIINNIATSDEEYKYDTLEQLKFEVSLRINIIGSAKELNKSGMSFKVFREAKCNDKYWKLSDEGGFLLKDKVKPSDAIKDIFLNGWKYGTECATAMVIIYYKALLNIYPEELFNKLFSEIYLLNWHYLDRDLEEIGYTEKRLDYLPGDRRYFKNPDVNPKTPEWQGENVIDLGNGTYYGHGIGIQNANRIISELNRYRKNGAKTAAFLLDAASRPDFKHLANIYYDFTHSLSRMNFYGAIMRNIVPKEA